MSRGTRKQPNLTIAWIESARKRSAQTLIELLVVVFIISLLVTLLLPALGRAVNEASSTVCRANLREIHQAMSMYRYDNGGWIPTGIPAGEVDGQFQDSISWFRQLAPRYLPNLAVLGCPDDPMVNDVREVLSPSYVEDYDNDLSSYGLSDLLISEADGALANLDRSYGTRPSDTLLIADLGTDFVPATTGARSAIVAWMSDVRSDGKLLLDDGYDPNSTDQRPAWLTDRHRGGINLVTVAGAIRYVKTQQMMNAPVLSSYPGCAAGGCALCNSDNPVVHYSFASSSTYWWTGTIPEEAK